MPGDIVHEFITSIEGGNLEHALTLLSDEVEYDNVPFGKVYGREAVRGILGPFLSGYDQVQWVVTHQVATGDADNGVVMNERLDRVRKGEEWFEIALAGLFVLRHGKITVWRDYFDRAQFEQSYAR